jgi:hypothetical protein
MRIRPVLSSCLDWGPLHGGRILVGWLSGVWTRTGFFVRATSLHDLVVEVCGVTLAGTLLEPRKMLCIWEVLYCLEIWGRLLIFLEVPTQTVPLTLKMEAACYSRISVCLPTKSRTLSFSLLIKVIVVSLTQAAVCHTHARVHAHSSNKTREPIPMSSWCKARNVISKCRTLYSRFDLSTM